MIHQVHSIFSSSVVIIYGCEVTGFFSRRHSFCIGRTRWEFLVFISSTQTHPSGPGNTFVTLANGQFPRATSSSATRTRSPTAALRHFWFLLLLSCNAGRYSLSHRFQKWLARMCTCFHLFSWYWSVSTNTPWGRNTASRWSRKWFGVNTSSSLVSSLLLHKGRLLTSFSTSTSEVTSTSSLARHPPKTAFRASFTDLTSRSQTPHMWDAPGAWTCLQIPFCRRYRVIIMFLVPLR